MNQFYLPRLDEIVISDYSLYRCPLKINFKPKLNIVYGTNGTGKSTLLMIILYSIIGPYRGGIRTKYRQEHRRDNRPIYNDSFFSERMVGESKEEMIPTVSSCFSINHDKYVVVHSLQDGKLLDVMINGKKLEGKTVSYRFYEAKYSKCRLEQNEEKELRDYLIFKYHKAIEKSSLLPGGINTLISMLLDVMFFDEGRKLTFWNSDLQETLIGKYIVDADFYVQYCEKKLNTKALESAYKKKSETLNYMRKFFEKEKELTAYVEIQSDNSEAERASIESSITRLNAAISDDQLLYSRLNNELMNTLRAYEDINGRLKSLEELWYNNLFPRQYEQYYNKFSNSLRKGICPICGNSHLFSGDIDKCFMCGEQLEVNEAPDLVKIDIERQNCLNKIAENKAKNSKIREELAKLDRRLEKEKSELDSMNLRLIEIQAMSTPDEDLLSISDRKRLERAREDRDEALRLYNKSKEQEEEMKSVIEDGLEENFIVFKKGFLQFASSFFGESHTQNLYLPFNDEDDLFSTSLMKFELDGKVRDFDYMLSESQRIFTDLAFRFSILTTFHQKSFFICETPDSTLDVFHEEKAVNTLLEFISQGNMLIISANARHSNLVSKLYNAIEADSIAVIDLTTISNLSLPNKFSFESYVSEVKG